MAAVSKIEDGVVELRTDVGRLYVCPTSWQRMYLHWTFRNFHTLPHQVLNGRQQRLINKLWRTAIVTPAEAVPPGTIIGVVENMKVLALPSTVEVTEAATTAPAVSDVKLAVVQGSAESAALDLNVPEPEIPAPLPRTSAPAIPENESTAATTDNPAEVCAPEVVAKPARRGDYKWILRTLELAGAAAVLLLAIELIPLWKAAQLESGRFPAPSVPPVFAAQVESRAAKASRRASEIGREAAAAKRLRAEAALSHPATPPPALPAAAALPQIVEAPRSGFIYPTAPNPNLVGKVVLKAVVGSDGTVKQVEVLSGDRALAAAAARAVRQWRYAPMEVQGRAVEAETHVTVSFLGDDAVSIILPPPQ